MAMTLEKKNLELIKKNKQLRKEIKSLKQDFEQHMAKANNERIRIQTFSRYLILKQEEDRKQISRELHDEIAQILTAINYELEVLSKEASRSAKKVRDKILNAQHMIVGSVDIIHRFARDLRPMILDDLGLSAALQSYIKEFHKRTDTVVTLKSDLKGLKLDDFSKTTLFRVAQEALINIAKHAKAKNASIVLKKEKDHFTMLIHDDGISFKPPTSELSKSKQGLGLLGMDDRVKMLEGDLSIKSSKKLGTFIRVRISLNKLKQNHKVH